MWKLLILVGTAWAQEPAEILRLSVQRDWNNWERSKNYAYRQEAEEREYDAAGRLKKADRETHEIMILAGRPYERLIERDGRPLAPNEAAKEQQKVDKELARRLKEEPADRARREREREKGRGFLREIPDAFAARLAGDERVSGQAAWVIDLEPRPGYRPRDSRAKMLPKIRARVWIDKADYNWVKLEAETLDTISFGLFLFRLGKGMRLHFEQTRVNDEVWLPSRLQAKADGRLALFKKIRREIVVVYSDYRKFQADSRLLDASEPVKP